MNYVTKLLDFSSEDQSTVYAKPPDFFLFLEIVFFL